MLEFGEHARPDGLDRLTPLGRRELELSLGIAVEQQVAHGFGEIAPRGLKVERHLLGERASKEQSYLGFKTTFGRCY